MLPSAISMTGTGTTISGSAFLPLCLTLAGIVTALAFAGPLF